MIEFDGDSCLRIAFLGGVPRALGGGGLEIQMERTADALRRLGHDVFDVDDAPADGAWDVVHAFGSEGDVRHAVSHWSRNRSPLVLSPVIVVSPGMAERSLRLLSRLPRPVFPARERRALLARADSIVAITRYEASLVRALIGDDARVCVIPNGVDLVTPAEQPPVDVVGAVLLLGGVSERKRQAGVIEALDGVARVVVAGGWSGGEDALRNFERVVAKAGATWLGEVRDPSAVAALQRDALALALMSRAEVQSLAVLEALAAGTPVLLSDIPSHRELAAAFPGSVYLISELSDLAAAVAAIRSAGQPPRPVLPSWRDVAVQLVAVYRSVVAT